MNNANKNDVTEDHVFRLLEGEIEDPTEIHRVMDAIDRSPALQAFYEMLSDEPDEDGLETTLLPIRLPDLRQTRLCRIKAVPELRKLMNGTSCETVAELEQSGRMHQFPVRLVPEGSKCRIEAEWPSGLIPLCFVLTQFGLQDRATGRTSFESIIRMPERAVHPAKDDGFQALHGSADQKIRSAAADASDPNSRAAGPPSYFAEVTTEGELVVRSSLPPDKDEEFVILELKYASRDQSAKTIHCPVAVSRSVDIARAETVVKDFPWPSDGLTARATIKVRPATEDDFTLLPPALVSHLLGTEHAFKAIPITGDGTVKVAHFLHAEDSKAAADESTSWFIRMAMERGDA